MDKSLNFCPRPPRYNKTTLDKDLKAFFRRIRLRAHFGISEYNPTILQQLKERNSSFTPQHVDTTIETFESAVIEDIKNHEKQALRSNNLTKGEINALKNLSKRDDLVITRADKGGATVIWGIDEYLTEANNQLNNTTFYKKLAFDPFQGYIRIINNSLDELHSQNKINAEALEILKVPKEVKPARFYLLPKIHKKNNPGRPVVASTNCHTTKLSKYVDHFIQPLTQKVRSYIRDTTDLLNKIRNIGRVPENALLVTLDVRSLYTNICHEEGLLALKNALNKRTNKEPATDALLTMMRHVLTLNCFTFNGNSYLQTRGCAMGTVAAPSYAIIYMGEFEEKHIYPIIGKDCLYYGRYIDDILLIYKGNEKEFKTFAEQLNTKHPSIKFDYEISKTSIPFLDTRIYIDENRQLQTTLFTKPTDTHNYLHYKSAHPRHLKNSLPYSQALRLRRICTKDDELHSNCKQMEEHFLRRGYHKENLQDQIRKAILTPRDTTLKKVTKERSKRIPLVTMFNSTLPQIGKILRERWDILNIKPKLKKLFSEPPIIAFRRCKNLREIIGSNTIINNKVLRKGTNKNTAKYCSPCNTKRSLCCNHIIKTNSFTSVSTHKTYKIFHESDCRSTNVIYLLECIRCKKQYVGKSEWPFNYRLNNYRSRIKSTQYDKLLPVEKHFKEQNHVFERDARFIIIEKIEKENVQNMTNLLETHEDNWIKRLQILFPKGLNNKLNHPDKH